MRKKYISWLFAAFPELWSWGDVVVAALQDVITGKKTAKEALEWANKEVYALMEKAGYYKK